MLHPLGTRNHSPDRLSILFHGCARPGPHRAPQTHPLSVLTRATRAKCMCILETCACQSPRHECKCRVCATPALRASLADESLPKPGVDKTASAPTLVCPAHRDNRLGPYPFHMLWRALGQYAGAPRARVKLDPVHPLAPQSKGYLAALFLPKYLLGICVFWHPPTGHLYISAPPYRVIDSLAPP